MAMNFAVPSTSLTIIKIVVIAIAVGAMVCLGTLSACMLLKLSPENAIITAFVGLTGQLVGSLTGLLINTRSTPSSDVPKTENPVV